MLKLIADEITDPISHIVNESIESSIERIIMDWSKQSDLVFDSKKTKTTLFSTFQTIRIHNLGNRSTYALNISNKTLERASSYKVLDIIFSENLTWKGYVKKLTQTVYHILRTLRHFKPIAYYNNRKNLAQSLVIAKTDYGNVVFENIPKF